MATKKSNTRSKDPKNPAAKAPAAQLREAKAKLADIERTAPPPPSMPTTQHPASTAAEAAGKVREEMALHEICDIIGTDCHADRFAETALESLAGQLSALRQVAEHEEVDGYECYRLMDNLVERMKLAGRVTAWLQSETTVDALPVVAP